MKIFLSWSGKRSLEVAKVFNEWLPTVIQSIDPWLSTEHIQKGASWLQEVKQAIDDSGGVGIFFLTEEALQSPWVLFEAGGVAALEHKRVCTVLVGLDQAKVTPPLSFFQGTRLDRADLLKLVKDLNSRMPTPLPDARLEKTFDLTWPGVKDQLATALAAGASATPNGKEAKADDAAAAGLQTSVLLGVAKSVQGIEARLGRLEEESQKGNSELGAKLGRLELQVNSYIFQRGLLTLGDAAGLAASPPSLGLASGLHTSPNLGFSSSDAAGLRTKFASMLDAASARTQGLTSPSAGPNWRASVASPTFGLTPPSAGWPSPPPAPADSAQPGLPVADKKKN